MIKPLADRIVVKPAEAEQKTSSGLFIPDNAKEKPMQGKVVAVGPGRKNDKGEIVPMEVKQVQRHRSHRRRRKLPHREGTGRHRDALITKSFK